MSRLHSIDALRAFAAVVVVYSHCVEFGLGAHLGPFPLERATLTWLTDYIDFGKIAVTLFFAVSGFVVPFSLFKPTRQPITDFILSRFLRLYPAYWLSMLAGLIVFFGWAGRDINVSLVLANLTMLQQFFGIENVVYVYWTLRIELIFYALCVGLFLGGYLDRRNAAASCAIALVVSAVVLALLRDALGLKLPVALPLALAVMFWGLCVRYHRLERRPGWGPTLTLVTLVLVCAVPLISVLAYNHDMGWHENWVKYTITYWFGMALFFILSSKASIQGRLFVDLGSISYSVYLFGPVVQAVLAHVVSGHEALIPIHVFFLATAIGTVAVATLVFRWIEAPAIAFGRHIIRRERERTGRTLPVVSGAK